ncbi:hypothetical protein BKA82DRAFT_871384, partial [Pisolithus tinctorius]
MSTAGARTRTGSWYIASRVAVYPSSSGSLALASSVVLHGFTTTRAVELILVQGKSAPVGACIVSRGQMRSGTSTDTTNSSDGDLWSMELLMVTVERCVAVLTDMF